MDQPLGKFAASIALLIACPAVVRAAPPHWIDAYTYQSASGEYKVVLDDANVVVDGQFKGLNTITKYPIEMTTDKGERVRSGLATFMLDCATGAMRAMRTGYLDAEGKVVAGDMIWRTVDSPPATTTAAIVKSKVCPP